MSAPPRASDSGSRTSSSLRFIEQFLQQAPPRRLTGLLLGQLDAFNRITTTFGHEHSDRFCAEYVEQLRRILPAGAPVVRLAERRFVVLLPLDSIATVIDVAGQLTEQRQAQVRIGDDCFVVDLTLGIAVHPTHADDSASLFRRAELALQEARERELAFDIYSPDTTQQYAALWKLESDLERAIQQGDLEVHYQPKVQLADGRVGGVEALARWRSPSGVFIPPQQFVPMAERSGSIVPLTWLVFDRVRDSLPLWGAQRAPFEIAVNLAPQVLTHPEFFGRLAALSEATVSTGAQLTLELTEDSLIQSADASAVLGRVRKLDVGIAIDDFGKGYSSLGYLKSIPATELKIDKRFIATVGDNEQDRHIVKAIVELGRAFRMKVVAEGVDNDRNLQAAAQLGCDLAQGFYIARAMRAELLGDWIRSFRRAARRVAAGPGRATLSKTP